MPQYVLENELNIDDDSDRKVFEGPETDWTALCEELVGQAIRQLVDADLVASRRQYPRWHEVRSEVEKLLGERGYQQVQNPTFSFRSSGMEFQHLAAYLPEDTAQQVREGVEASLREIQAKYSSKPTNIIDCDTIGIIPNNWLIHSNDQLPNVVRGKIEFDPKNVAFHLDDTQKTSNIIGEKLRYKFDGVTVYGAHVLDYLLANPNLIPESWKVDEQGRPRYIFFWGTVYRDSDGSRIVRSLSWDGSMWGESYEWLEEHHFDDQDPAPVFAS